MNRHHWNGYRWVSDGEYRLALKIRNRVDAQLAYLKPPWYKKLFTKNPNKEN